MKPEGHLGNHSQCALGADEQPREVVSSGGLTCPGTGPDHAPVGENDGEPVYYQYDPHLNRCGQETLATFLLQHLE